MEFVGGCYCGQVRYKASGDPAVKLQCNCRECQYLTGGGPALPHRGGPPVMLVRRFPRSGVHAATSSQ